ncbi:hypothetical protein EVAR_22587_1 [Eumeta japonica]|uniref:Uncharacterized protein n=1 Tax=Eumeta variegata TaxID=151549 RepID=A0A4C1U7K0_EUMVA|nr:hypothetical protein EVAR_22587_1 [Eumeta japonica]
MTCERWNMPGVILSVNCASRSHISYSLASASAPVGYGGTKAPLSHRAGRSFSVISYGPCEPRAWTLLRAGCLYKYTMSYVYRWHALSVVISP